MEKEGKGKAPLVEIDLDKKQITMDKVSRYLDAGADLEEESKASAFKELPSFLGKYGSEEGIKKVPTQYKPSPKIMDSTNL